MKTIKIIDLVQAVLTLKSKDEEVYIPTFIKYKDEVYCFDDRDLNYYAKEGAYYLFCWDNDMLDFLNDEVEIIEKEKIISVIQDYGVKMKEFCETTRRIWKLIEEYPIEKEEEKEIEPLAKLGNYKVNTGDDFLDKVLTNINERINHLIDKQTELIDVVNEMRKEK